MCGGGREREEEEEGSSSFPPATPVHPRPQNVLQPFFVFQMVCVALWSLDEYWYYAIFTLVMLVIFESTVCLQRLRSLEYLREKLRLPYLIWCVGRARSNACPQLW